MSDFHLRFAQRSSPSSNLFTNSLRRQISTAKLLNNYLSTAAQYLNRTKSFHIPPTPMSNFDEKFPSTPLCPARSVPMNINNLSAIYQEHRFSSDEPDNKKKIKDQKTMGIVNTIRRSLRKSRDRFYNKRSMTMKSCHSLPQYDPSINIHSPISLTPILSHRNGRTDEFCPSMIIDEDRPNNGKEKYCQLRKRNHWVCLSSVILIDLYLLMKKNSFLIDNRQIRIA